jgi:hypothetical protein
MNKEEFYAFRQRLNKTQRQMADLLGTSLKAVQSFEQGWRRLPVHVERQILFLAAMQKTAVKNERPCWDIQNCSEEIRQTCPAWEFHAGHLCWFINGTICKGKPQSGWSGKMKVCRRCGVFKEKLGPVKGKKESQKKVGSRP